MWRGVGVNLLDGHELGNQRANFGERDPLVANVGE